MKILTVEKYNALLESISQLTDQTYIAKYVSDNFEHAKEEAHHLILQNLEEALTAYGYEVIKVQVEPQSWSSINGSIFFKYMDYKFYLAIKSNHEINLWNVTQMQDDDIINKLHPADNVKYFREKGFKIVETEIGRIDKISDIKIGVTQSIQNKQKALPAVQHRNIFDQ